MTVPDRFGDFAGYAVSLTSGNITFGQGKATTNGCEMVAVNPSSLVKTQSAWSQGSSGGLMDGSTAVPSNPWVHLYVLGKSSTGDSDVIGSYNYPTTGPILPSGWDCWRWFNARMLDGSGNWLAMAQNGDRNEWISTWLDVNGMSLGMNATSVFLAHVPAGVVTKAILNIETTASATGISEIGAWNPAVTTIQPGTADCTAIAMDYSGGSSGGSAEIVKVTNSAQQIILFGNNQNGGINYASVRVLGFEVIL